jgi:hypothetical protein
MFVGFFVITFIGLSTRRYIKQTLTISLIGVCDK